MSSPDNPFNVLPQRMVRPLDVEPGHWKKQLPTKYLDLAKRGDLPGLKALLQTHPEFLSKRGPHNRTMLWEAARAGKFAAVTMLVDAGADMNATGAYNNETLVQITPYCAARYYRREAIADYLWAHGSTIDGFRAAFLGDQGKVEQELAENPELLNAEDPNDEIYYIPLLSFAVAGGKMSVADFLIRRGAPVAQYSAQLLGLAARSSRRDLVDLLLANGADARAVGVGLFADVSDLDLLRYLIGVGVSPRGHGRGDIPPVVYVARGDKGERPDKVRLLLDHGADVNAVGPNGKTALHYAATAGHANVVALLLDRGANTALLDNEGHTAWDLARAAGKVPCAALQVSRPTAR